MMKRKILLTSSQVSVLLTTAIVLLFTTALFLSGFAIQQRTLRQLRASIREPARPSPKVFLPDRFRAATTELEDGTVVALESEAEREARGWAAEIERRKGDKSASFEHVEVTTAEMGGQASESRRTDEEEEEQTAAEKALEEEELDLRERTLREQAEKNQRNPDPDARNQKPITRAERRRLIKEELFKLAHEDKPVYYQRRLW